jgi:hypothetical protein
VGQPARNNVAWRRICPGPLAIFPQRPVHARVMKLTARSHHCRCQTIATAPPGLAPPTASPLPMCAATHPYLLPYQSRGQVGEKYLFTLLVCSSLYARLPSSHRTTPLHRAPVATAMRRHRGRCLLRPIPAELRAREPRH